MRFLKILTSLISSFIFALIVATVGLGYFKLMDPIHTYIVSSGSMEPIIKTGGLVLVQPTSMYSTGDIITFYSSPGKKNSLVTHRIVDTHETLGQLVYQTKGDANKTNDPAAVAPAQVVGKLLFTVPYVGFALDKIKTPLGFIFVVVIPATIVVYEELKKVTAEMKKINGRAARLTESEELFLQSIEKMREEERPRFDMRIGVLLLFLVMGLVLTKSTISFFSDTEQSPVQVVASEVFSSPTPTP